MPDPVIVYFSNVCSFVAQNGGPVFVSFSLHNFDLHGCAVDAGDFEHTQFIESESGPMGQSDHAKVLHVFNCRKKMFYLLLRQPFSVLVIFLRKELGREHVPLSQNVFEKEAEALCCIRHWREIEKRL